ncbi:MAG: hypothetical protein PWQ95_1527 [Thermococcaceae archaeon]|nr:hypothetical protein [Thermococcaceae archaeon]
MVIEVTTFKKGITYPPILVGLILLFAALIMSFAASYRTLEKSDWRGVFGPGSYNISEGEISSYDVINRTLTIWSDNTSIVLSVGGENLEYVLRGEKKILTLPSPPEITVLSGSVEYEYTVYWLKYPYSYLAYPAFILMAVGGVFAFRGYLSFLESLKEEARKKGEEGKDEDSGPSPGHR